MTIDRSDRPIRPAGIKQVPASTAGSSDASHINIIDIRTETDEQSILGEIQSGLRPQDGEQKSLPTMLLYAEAGLKLFEAITYLEEYY